MRLLKFIFITFILIGGIGYGIYYFGTNMASEKIVAEVSSELENSGYLEEAKRVVNNDPEIKRFIEEAAQTDESQLPFTTKEQATRVLIQKIGISELLSIQSKAQSGMTEDELFALLTDIEGKLTDEEILALKVIAYKELNK